MPSRCLAAFGYCEPEPEGVNSEENQFDHQPKADPPARLWPFAHSLVFYLAAVYAFWLLKHYA